MNVTSQLLSRVEKLAPVGGTMGRGSIVEKMHLDGSKVHTLHHGASMFFVAYTGLSMHPTLREPAIMEIVPYHGAPVRVGDVVYFLPPGTGEAVVHRVVRVARAGITTRGDNNAQDDSVLLQLRDIYGQVVASRCGRKRRHIVGGALGSVASYWWRWRRILDRGVSRLLHPVYDSLSCWGGIARLLPAPCRPHVAIFSVHGQAQYWLLLGRQIIGRYDDRRQSWQIQRPFRLLVEERTLLRRQKADREQPCD